MIYGSKVEDFEHRQDEMGKAKETLKKAKELEKNRKLRPFRYDANTVVHLPDEESFKEWKKDYESRRRIW